MMKSDIAVMAVFVALAGCGDNRDTPAVDASPADAAEDASADAPPDADLTFSESCERTVDEPGWHHIEPAISGPSLTLQLLRHDGAVFPFHGSCIMVRPSFDGAILDQAFDDAYWNATLGRAPGEDVWVLDPTPSEPTNAPSLGIGVRNVPTNAFPTGLDMEFAFPVVPSGAHVTAYYNPQDELTEPDWITSSARSIVMRHWDFSTTTVTPIEPHPFSWVFTRPGHYFVRVTATITPVSGPPLSATDHVHFVVVEDTGPVELERPARNLGAAFGMATREGR